jgi:AcrR family transcriptional regulator
MRMKPWNVDNVNMADTDDASTPASSRQGYHHGRLRQALIDAGMAALTHTEAADLSLRALARELNVSANAVYRHFADKDALLSAVAAEGFRLFSAAQNEAMSEDNASSGIASGLRYVQFAQAHPNLFRLMFSLCAPGPTQEKHPHDEEFQTSARHAFEQLLRNSAAPNTRNVFDEATLFKALARWSLVHGLSHLLLEGQLALFGPKTDSVVTAILQASGVGGSTSPPSVGAPQWEPTP